MAAAPPPPAEWMREVMTYWLKFPEQSGVLHLPDRELTEIPSEVNSMKNVVVLSFPRNKISKFPKKIENMRDTLKTIDLSINKITKLPSSLSEFKHLESLIVAGNEIKTWPSVVAKIKNLTCLDLCDTKLKSVPSEVSKMFMLEKFYLSDNPALSKLKLDKTVFSMVSLTSLRMAGCGIESIPEAISGLGMLKVLDLSRNKLSTVPAASFLKLTNLRECLLDGNLLEKPVLELGLMRKLELLHLHDNPFCTQEEYSHLYIPKLEEIAKLEEEVAIHKATEEKNAKLLAMARAARASSAPASPATGRSGKGKKAKAAAAAAAAAAANNEEDDGKPKPPPPGSVGYPEKSKFPVPSDVTKLACIRLQLGLRELLRRDPITRRLLFEEKQNKANIEFRLKVDGDPKAGLFVVSSTIEKLILYLTDKQPPDQSFIRLVLLLWDHFTTPVEWMSLIKVRYMSVVEKDSQIEKLRTFNLFKKWIESAASSIDWDKDVAACDMFQSLMSKFSDTGLAQGAKSLEEVVEHARKGGKAGCEDEEDTPSDSEIPAASAAGGASDEDDAVLPPSFELLSVSPKDLAAALTAIEYNLFRSIQTQEFMHLRWQKKGKEENAPNVLRLIDRFNEVSKWVATTLVKELDLKKRSQLLGLFILTAHELLATFHNFNAVFSIMSSLSSAPILRLKETWKLLPTKVASINEKLNVAIDGSGNFRNYRDLVKVDAEDGTTKFLACLPYLGMVLSDLTFIEEGNGDFVVYTVGEHSQKTDLINFHKFQMIGKTIEHILNNQQNSPLPADTVFMPGLRAYLQDMDTFTDEELYNASQDCEAGGRSRSSTASSAVPPKSASASELSESSAELRQQAFQNRRKLEEAKAVPAHMLRGRPRSHSAVALTLPKSTQKLIEREKAKDAAASKASKSPK